MIRSLKFLEKSFLSNNIFKNSGLCERKESICECAYWHNWPTGKLKFTKKKLVVKYEERVFFSFFEMCTSHSVEIKKKKTAYNDTRYARQVYVLLADENTLRSGVTYVHTMDTTVKSTEIDLDGAQNFVCKCEYAVCADLYVYVLQPRCGYQSAALD